MPCTSKLVDGVWLKVTSDNRVVSYYRTNAAKPPFSPGDGLRVVRGRHHLGFFAWDKSDQSDPGEG